MRQGRVYVPRAAIPPGQQATHFIVVLTNNKILNRLQFSGGNGFVVGAIIRSAINQRGQRVGLVPLHSIPITPMDLPSLHHDSIIETHQLFHLPLQEFIGANGVLKGDLPGPILTQVLAGAKHLVS